MKKRVFAVLVLICLSALVFGAAMRRQAAAAAAAACGESLQWYFGEGCLTIAGEGEMYDYTDETDIPWGDVREEIRKVVIEDGVTRIGNAAFYKCVNLTEVRIPCSVCEIGDCAFYECSSLERIDLPEQITRLGYRTFYSATPTGSTPRRSRRTSREAPPRPPRKSPLWACRNKGDRGHFPYSFCGGI